MHAGKEEIIVDARMEGAVVALLIGLLLGLERERSKRAEQLFAGIRTFPLLSVCGYLAGLAGNRGLPWLLPSMLLIVGGFGIASFLRGEDEAGVTTEVSALVATLLGAAVAWDLTPLAASLAVITTLLLTLKSPLHRFAGAVTQEEILAIVKFGIVAIVLLPLLPNQAMGPYGALVPRKVGIVVVLLSGVSLAGYLMVRLLGGRAGWALAGLMGGLVSSTATTLSLSGKAREAEADSAGASDLVRHLAVGIVLASTVLYVRGAFLFGLLDRRVLAYTAPRLGALMALGLVLAVVQFRRPGQREAGSVSLGNPAELGRAVGLAVVFAAVIVISRAAQAHLGAGGLWSVGILGGFVDADSVAVAMARLSTQNLTSVETASHVYVVATLANLVFKSGVVWTVGGAQLARKVLPAFATLAAATIALLLYR